MLGDPTGPTGADQNLFKTLAKVLYLAVGLVVLVWFVYQVSSIILAGVLALILAIALNAPVTWLERRNVGRAVGTAISFFALVGIAAFVGWLVVPRLAEEIPELVERVPELVETVAGALASVAGDHPEVEEQVGRVFAWLAELFDGLWRYTGDLLAALVLGIFVLALVLYMVVYMRPLLAWYVKSMPAHLREEATRAFSRASGMVIGWVYATVVLGGIKALAVFIFLAAAGVPGALVWSVLAFLGAFVPQVGFYIMTIPPVLMVLVEDPLLALWTFLYYTAFSELLGRFVAPWIYAEAMHLNPVYVLFMILAIGYAFGLVGVLIATPVAGFIKAYYDEFYLKRQPEVASLEERVEAMVERRAG